MLCCRAVLWRLAWLVSRGDVLTDVLKLSQVDWLKMWGALAMGWSPAGSLWELLLFPVPFLLMVLRCAPLSVCSVSTLFG